MKLVMKASDEKEIVYFSNNDFDIGYLDEMENSLVIDISSSLKIYKEYLKSFFNDFEKEDFIRELSVGKNKDSEFVLKTKKYYFIFENKLVYTIDQIAQELNPDESINITIAYAENTENTKEYKGEWHCFNIGIIKNNYGKQSRK